MSGVRFDHVAIALPRIADAPAVLGGVLGGVPRHGAPSRGFAWGVWRFDGGGRIEIIEPRGEESFVRRFLDRRGPGVHHVTFKVPSLGETCARATAAGYVIVGRDDSDPEWQEAFLHPKDAQGVVVQFAESHPAPPGAPRLRWEPPPGPPDPPPPATIVGLRLSARSEERARRQWAEVLGGEVGSGPGGELTCRWPGSPMRIVVEIDPAREEGPLAIEVAAGRALGVPDGPHPVLGVRLVQVAAPAGSPATPSDGAIEERVGAVLATLGLPWERHAIDPAFADTAAYCERYGVPLDRAANTIIVASKKEPRQLAACVVKATTRLDVNRAVRRLMGVSKVSFATAEETRALTGMMIGGVTVFALPEGLPIYVDERLLELDWVILGSGSRSSKIRITPEVFRRLPGAQIVAALAVEA